MFVAVISWHTILHIYILAYVLGARAASKLFLNFFFWFSVAMENVMLQCTDGNM